MHVLIPHKIVTAIKDWEGKWAGLEVRKKGNSATYYYEDHECFTVARHGIRVVLEAHREIWIQEPGITTVVRGSGEWRGYGKDNYWTKTTNRVDGWLPVKQKDAHKSTVHHSRVEWLDNKRTRRNPNFTVGLEYRDGKERWRFRTNGGFAALLRNSPGKVPYEGCKIFNTDEELQGVWNPEAEALRRTELAGLPPDKSQYHALGWSGGPAAVVGKSGTEIGAPGNVLLWNPSSWRKMKAQQSITQSHHQWHGTT